MSTCTEIPSCSNISPLEPCGSLKHRSSHLHSTVWYALTHVCTNTQKCTCIPYLYGGSWPSPWQLVRWVLSLARCSFLMFFSWKGYCFTVLWYKWMACQCVVFVPSLALWALGKAWVLHLKATPMCVLLKNPQLVHSLSQQKSAVLSHNPTSSSPCPPFLFCQGLPPFFLCRYSAETSEWQWETSWDREARTEKSAPVLLSSQSLWKEILPWHKESSIFCARKHLRPFLVAAVPAPLAQSHPRCASPHSSHPFHCFPFVTRMSLNLI